MAFKISNPLTSIVLCSHITCGTCVKIENAIWDNEYELPYCSKEHLNLDKEAQTARSMDFEDGILGYIDEYPFDDPRSDGYVSEEDAQENYLFTFEEYDYDR